MPRLRRAPPPPEDFDDDDECFREKPGQRNAANARERARMRILSKAFSRLKTTLPWVPPDTKLSKLDTLRLATSYIAHLRTILTDDGEATSVVHPLNLTWPFTIQNPPCPDSAKSPDWSSEDTSPVQTVCRRGIVSCLADSSSCGDLDEERKDFPDDEKTHFLGGDRHFSDDRHYPNDIGIPEGKCYTGGGFIYVNADHRHLSDSLLNIS